MNVDLGGRLAVFYGADGAVSAALQDAMAENGARVIRLAQADQMLQEDRGQPFVLVNISRGSNGLPEVDGGCGSELQDFAHLTRRLAPRLGRVVNVFSSAGLVPVKGFAEFCAAQAGLLALTRTLAMELGPDLRVNAVAVGACDDGTSGVATSRFVSHTALRRPATLAEVGAAALFLADPDNAYMTGHTLNVDGGWAVGYSRNF